ncbi:MAG: DUF1840 family protein [Pseudomonadales bacterium]|jgi:Ran GTPase-activating protein (RanGAP) involved in mRNA processing and transport|nr:DUF1840 family protein [Pseudomonadales bacterium]
MLIKFESQDAASFEMLESHALPLLSLIGQSGKSEGSISGPALNEALDKLEAGLAKAKEDEPPETRDEDDWDDEDEDEEEEAVPLANRAVPLKRLLKHAIAEDTYLMWRPA